MRPWRNQVAKRVHRDQHWRDRPDLAESSEYEHLPIDGHLAGWIWSKRAGHAMTSKLFQGPFLFVNKDATNIKQRNADQAHAIGSHVSGRYARWSKTSRLRPVDALKAKLVTTPITSELPGRETTRDGYHTASTQSPSSTTGDVQRSSSGQTTPDSSTARSELPRRSLVRQSPPGLMTVVQHGNSDPFSASSVQITPFNNYLITQWQTIFTQTVYPSEVLSNVPTTSSESADMLACPERIHFLLAWALMLHLSAMPASQTKNRLEVKALTHKSAGMTLLQKSLPTMAKLTAIRAVWHLLGVEFYGRNPAAALTHFRAMVNMVRSIGGLKNLPWELRKLIVVSDMTISGMLGTRSAFDVDEWDPGSVTPILLVSEAEILAANFLAQQPLHDCIPSHLIDIFLSYRELLAVHCITADVQDSSRLTALLLWTQMRQYALSTRVTNIKAVLDDLPASAEKFIEKATCVGVDYFLQILWLKNHTERTVLAPFHHSRGSFEILQGVAQLEMSPLTLWILFVAATVELILRQRGQKSSVFAKKFTGILQGLRLHSLDRVRGLLSRFLYQGDVFDQYLCVLIYPVVDPNMNLELDTGTDVCGKNTFSNAFWAPARFGSQHSTRLNVVDS